MEAINEHPPNDDPGGDSIGVGNAYFDNDRPEIKDTSGLGGWIWIVLFGSVITISVFANLLLTVLVARNRKKHNLVYFVHLLLFAINLVDFSVLIFEFSLGIEHEYPYNQTSCTIYQVAAKGNPILQASAILGMLICAAKTYSTPNNQCMYQTSVSPNSLFKDNNPSGHTHNFIGQETHNQVLRCSRTNDFLSFGRIVLSLVIIECILSIPTAFMASIINLKDKKYCEIDLTSSSFLQKNGDIEGTMNSHYNSNDMNQTVISAFYLIYSSILSFWLPLLIAIIPAARLIRDTNRDKYPEVSVVLATVSSFFIFYIFHASIVFVRHFYDLSWHDISTYNLWMIRVGQSLLLLVAYFWHFARPALAISLDPDLKEDLAKLFTIGGYRGLSTNEMINDSQSPPCLNHPNFVHAQEMNTSTGKWRVLLGAKHVFTNTLFGQHPKSDRNSIFGAPFREAEVPASYGDGNRLFSPHLEPKHDLKSTDDEILSALSQNTENVGENKC